MIKTIPPVPRTARMHSLPLRLLGKGDGGRDTTKELLPALSLGSKEEIASPSSSGLLIVKHRENKHGGPILLG
jgi:hypothetical protein